MKIGLKYTRRVVREVEGAALEMLRFFEKAKLHKAFNDGGSRHINNFAACRVLIEILIKLNIALTSRKRVNIYGSVSKWS